MSTYRLMPLHLIRFSSLPQKPVWDVMRYFLPTSCLSWAEFSYWATYIALLLYHCSVILQWECSLCKAAVSRHETNVNEWQRKCSSKRWSLLLRNYRNHPQNTRSISIKNKGLNWRIFLCFDSWLNIWSHSWMKACCQREVWVIDNHPIFIQGQ